MIEIKATEQDWKALITLIDSALRHNGINGAGTAVQWAMKIEAALKQKNGDSVSS